MATELQRLKPPGSPGLDRQLWGTWALYQAPQSVLEVHKRYVSSGCDVISTKTWSILSAPEAEQRVGAPTPERRHWMDMTRLGIHLPRRAISDGGWRGEWDYSAPKGGLLTALLSRIACVSPRWCPA